MTSPVTLVSSILFCLLLVNVHARRSEKSSENGLKPFMDELGRAQRGCFDFFKSSLKKVLMTALGMLKKGDEESANGQMRCFVTCLLKKTGVVKGDDGEINEGAILASLKNPTEEQKENVKNGADLCKKEAEKETSACDKGYTFINCMFKSVNKGKNDSGAEDSPADPDSGAEEDEGTVEEIETTDEP